MIRVRLEPLNPNLRNPTNESQAAFSQAPDLQAFVGENPWLPGSDYAALTRPFDPTLPYMKVARKIESSAGSGPRRLYIVHAEGLTSQRDRRVVGIGVTATKQRIQPQRGSGKSSPAGKMRFPVEGIFCDYVLTEKDGANQNEDLHDRLAGAVIDAARSREDQAAFSALATVTVGGDHQPVGFLPPLMKQFGIPARWRALGNGGNDPYNMIRGGVPEVQLLNLVETAVASVPPS